MTKARVNADNASADIQGVTAGTGLTGGGTSGTVTLNLDTTAVIQPTIVDAKGDIIAATGADAVSRLAVGANNTVLTADSSTATGLKWAAPDPLTTKGDLFTYSTTETRLPVGSNGTVLTADSAEATGLKWAIPAASGGMTLLASTTVSGAPTLITFSSINQTYKHLLITWQFLLGTATSGTNYWDLGFNNMSTNAAIFWDMYNGSFSSGVTTKNYIHSIWQQLQNQQTQGNGGACMVYNYSSPVGNEISFNSYTLSYNSPNSRLMGNRSLGVWTGGAINRVDFQLFGSGGFFNGGKINIYGVN